MTERFVAALAALLLAAAPAAAPAATGPLAVRMETDPTLRYHTIFRPEALPRAERLPVVVFAGGGCRNAGARFREPMSEVASHGYFVIALGEAGDPDHDANPDAEVDYHGRPTKTDVSQITHAIAWAEAEEARAGSAYHGKLDLARVAVMGQSCGGVQAIDVAARQPGIKTLVVLNSGLWANDLEMGGSTIKRADLPKIAMPTLILLGGKGDVAYDNGQANFDLMTNAPVLVASADYGHRATYFEKDGGLFGKVVVQWLAWQLKGDAAAVRTFLGADCGLCRDKQWTVRSRLTPGG